MWSKTSEALKIAVENSALKNSAIPIFICDENLTVCCKSAGAERLFARPAVRNSICPYISEINTLELCNGTLDHISTTFSRAKNSSYCLITSGAAGNIRFFAVMIEPMIRFCPPIEPWYIKESAKTISRTLEMLLNEVKIKPHDLQTVQTRLCRLCSFFDSESRVGNVFSNLNGIMDFAVSAAQPILRSVHAAITLDPSHIKAINIFASPTSIYMVTATMIAASVMLSRSGKISLSYNYSENDESATVCIATDASELLRPGIDSFSKLITPENPLSMELAALNDMAEASGFLLGTSFDNGIVSLTVKLRALAVDHGTFRSADISGTDVNFFTFLLTDMLRLLDTKK